MEHTSVEVIVSAIGGPIGALAYASLNDHTTVKQKATEVFVGSAVSVFVGPWIVASLTVESLAGYRLIIFLSGLFGNIFLRTSMSYVEKNAADLFVSLLQRVLRRIQLTTEKTQASRDDTTNTGG